MAGDQLPERDSPSSSATPSPKILLVCPACGMRYVPGQARCEVCDADLSAAAADPHANTPSTLQIARPPSIVASEHEAQSHFQESGVLLQFLPSGTCYQVEVPDTIVLGRTNAGENSPHVLDLSELNALTHGVSRRHCLLGRRGQYLVARDLGSTNGTFLNDTKLMPQVDHVLAHGDRLILGTLHVTIFFGSADGGE